MPKSLPKAVFKQRTPEPIEDILKRVYKPVREKGAKPKRGAKVPEILGDLYVFTFMPRHDLHFI